MKSSVLVGLLLAIMAASQSWGQEAAASTSTPEPLFCDVGRVKVDSDRYSGEARATTSSESTYWATPTLVWSSLAPDSVGIVFHLKGADWRYLECSSTYILVDDHPVRVESQSHDGFVLPDAKVEERITTVVRWDVVASWASLDRFEYKICADELVADEDFVCQVRDFVRAVAGHKAKP